VRPLDGLKEFDELHYLIKALGEKSAEEFTPENSPDEQQSGQLRADSQRN
jgi:hypothetical protein